LIGAVFSYTWQYHYTTILDKGCYFFSGIFLADCYLLRKKDNDGMKVALMMIFVFGCWLFIPAYYVSLYFCVIKLFITLLLFYVAITNDKLKKFLSIEIIAIIGGMCYSIYLVHMGVYGLMRHHFFSIQFSNIAVVSLLIQLCISVFIVLIVSGVFFLLIEKPTMEKDWYKKIFTRRVTL